jgi:hypothetical protein
VSGARVLMRVVVLVSLVLATCLAGAQDMVFNVPSR